MTKPVVFIFGITGVQGSTVAKTFLEDDKYTVRGVSRDPEKPDSQSLIKLGAEIRKGDLGDVQSLKDAVEGANLVFANTAFPNQAAMPGKQQWGFETESQQGKNIADAVNSTIKTVERFVWSALSGSTKWSKGSYKNVYHFDSKQAVVDYIKSSLPDLWAKTSIYQMGLWTNNWVRGPLAVPWYLLPDGSMELRIPAYGQGDEPVPFIVPQDTGMFVKALLEELPVGTNLLAYGDRLPWSEYIQIWSRITGIPAVCKRVPISDHATLLPGGFGTEMGEMYGYMVDVGYHGGDPEVTMTSDVPSLKPTRLEEYIKSTDWSPLKTPEWHESRN